MEISDTLKSIKELTNFYDQQLFVHCGSDAEFYAVKNGTLKRVKFPPHMQKILTDKKILSKTFTSNGETTVLHIFRLGDDHTLFVSDPGTGNVLNGFIMSLITISAGTCTLPSSSKNDSDMNSVLLDKLVAEFDKEKAKFSVTEKRQKEEIIILEEQAREAYNQLDEAVRELSGKENEIAKLQMQIRDINVSYKAIDKQLRTAEFDSDFKRGTELKKKNDLLRENNKKLVAMIKKNVLAVDELKTELEMYMQDTLEGLGTPAEKQQEIMDSIKELFSSEKLQT